MSAQSLADRLKDISLGLATRRYTPTSAIEKLDSIAEELRRTAAGENAINTAAAKAMRRFVWKVNNPHAPEPAGKSLYSAMLELQEVLTAAGVKWEGDGSDKAHSS